VDFIVLGATGFQGRIVSRDLLQKGYRVVLAGRSGERVAHLLKKHKKASFSFVELRDKNMTRKVLKASKAPIVVNCAEGDWNLDVQKLALELGKHYLDLGSDPDMTADQFALHAAFEKKNLCAMTGCGSVPGIGNVMLRHATEHMDTVQEADAGFAWTANEPIFVPPFSIITVIEEFTDRPTIFDHGKMKKLKAGSGSQKKRFWYIGEQNEFLARHPEPYTFAQFLKDKGIKKSRFYSGFPPFSYNKIQDFIKNGAGSKAFIKKGVRKIDLLAESMKNTKLPKGYLERENLWVTVWGTRNGKKHTIRMNCLVPTLKGWEEHGCNIDTGLPCSIMAQMLHKGLITNVGARSPEYFVPVDPFFKELAKRKMRVFENGRRLN
jgi:saccharopine dehydrogenase-like NADP-dependent oxidoreductase